MVNIHLNIHPSPSNTKVHCCHQRNLSIALKQRKTDAPSTSSQTLGKESCWGLPWWLSGKILPAKYTGDMGSIPGREDHTLQGAAKLLPQLLSPCAGAQEPQLLSHVLQLLKPTHPGAWLLCTKEATTMRSPSMTTREWPVLASIESSEQAATKSRSSKINKLIKSRFLKKGRSLGNYRLGS